MRASQQKTKKHSSLNENPCEDQKKCNKYIFTFIIFHRFLENSVKGVTENFSVYLFGCIGKEGPSVHFLNNSHEKCRNISPTNSIELF